MNFFIGIDISKLSLDLSILDRENPSIIFHFKVENNIKGLKNIFKQLKKQKVDFDRCLFCCENTGVYTIPLSLFLHRNCAKLWIVPAMEIKLSKGIVRGKTDKSDSKDIAFYALRNLHKYKPIALPEKSIQQLKLLHAEREKVIKSIKAFSQTSENIGYMPKEIMAVVIKSNKNIILQLKKTLKQLEQKMQEIITENKELNKQYKLLLSVPGIGIHTARYLLIITKGFTCFANWRKMACYAGVAPFEYSSGTSVKGRTKVHNLADRKMKTMLQMGVLSMIKSDPEIKIYYNRKKAEGKNSMLVMNNIRCKILSRAFAVVKRGSEYVKLKQYAA